MRAVVSLLLVGVCFGSVLLAESDLHGQTKEPCRRGPGLDGAKVAVLYENITDGVSLGRSIEATVQILEETHAELVLRCFWKWSPVVNSPDELPEPLVRFATEVARQQGRRTPTRRQIADRLRRTGHYYQELARWIGAIKKERPGLIFVGAIPAQTLARVEWNPTTGETYDAEQTWAMALDPQKWHIRRGGEPVTKQRFQAWFYGVHPYGSPVEEYDRSSVGAYFPDITNPQFQERVLSWAKKQVDCGTDAIWIDMLYRQATLLAQMTRDPRHPSVRESLAAASGIVEQIRRYGAEQGKQICVGSWVGPFVLAPLAGREFPYDPPKMDFVTLSPTIKEVLAKRLDEARWTKAMALVHESYGQIPLIAFIDWSFDASPLVAFSQKLAPDEQRMVLDEFDRVFQKLGVIFAYPVHGGYMGKGDVTRRMAFGREHVYDALAPEFSTYETIKRLAVLREAKAGTQK